ncbi:hypothetical protein M231_01774 [Tremella mesenterica]|uniref:mRNA export factor GLE1 n=1 Tax=Tremella mesenterica TaxID=5217 RepID=A0A4Q1BSI7_TREME|nr:hypothetical protein M231_01774 [Tremella mesenterica]
MKFALDSDSDSGSISSSETDSPSVKSTSSKHDSTSQIPNPMSELGRRIREATLEPESDDDHPRVVRRDSYDSENEAADLLDVASEVSSVSESDEEPVKQVIPPVIRNVPAEQGVSHHASSGASKQTMTMSTSRSLHDLVTRKAGVATLRDESTQPSPPELFARRIELEALTNGQMLINKRMALIRRAVSEEPTVSPDSAWLAKQEMKREQDEIARLMQAMTVEKKERAGALKNKISGLWSSIDVAVSARTKQATEAQHRAEAAKKLEEEKKQAEAQRAAQVVKKAEDERRAAKEAAERRAREEADLKREAEDKAAEEQRQAEIRKKEQESAITTTAASSTQTPERAALVTAVTQENQRTRTMVHQRRGSADFYRWRLEQDYIKKNIHQPVKTNPALKGSLFKIAAKMRRFVGQVTNKKSVIVRVTGDIHKILCEQLGRETSAANPAIYKTDLPVAYLYMTSRLAKCLIEQAEAEVSVKADAAFPVAWVVLGLLVRGHASFGPILFSRLAKKCPWVVPHLPRPDSSDPAAIRKAAGFDVNETTSSFVERMTGICTFYFAILQTSLTPLISTLPIPPTPQQLLDLVIPEFRLPRAWTWLRSILQPRTIQHHPVSSLIAAWLRVCGAEVMRTYGPAQTGKLLNLVGDKASLLGAESTASRERVHMLLDECARKGSVEGHPRKMWE